MARRHAVEQEETEINITPMLDIVFIMLIFFIVTTSFTKETGASIIKPVAEQAVACLLYTSPSPRDLNPNLV